MGPHAVALARLSATSSRMPRQGADCIQVPPRKGPIPIVTARFLRAAHRAGLPGHEPQAEHEEERTIGVSASRTARRRGSCDPSRVLALVA